MTPSTPRTPPFPSRPAAANRPEARTAPAPPAPAWSTCPECWGQRRIIEFRPAGNGEGSIPVLTTCSRCLGIGDVLR